MTNAELDPADDAHDTASAWLLRLRSGEAGPADVDAFERWCAEHPGHAGRLRETWSLLRTAAGELARDERAGGVAWTGVAKRERAMRTGRRAFIGFAVAAGASWLAVRPPLGLWPSLGDLAANYRTGTGEQRQIVLSSRVTVEMNTQTRLDMIGSQDAQGFELVAGETEIDAAAPVPGRADPVRPVTVVAGRGRIDAAVARFNVRRMDGQVCVTCMSGSLTLDHPGGRRTLVAAEQVVYDDRRVDPVTRVDTGPVTAWRRGVLVFNDVPLSDVVEQINRYRPGKVILRNASLGENRMQAQFPIARVDSVIDLLGRLYGAHITRLPGNIVLVT
ncbi:FecR family protein [Burkholderia plantarii]|uniref:Fe(2+)-dicitrate sensor, transmembrane component FecR n=1 Tax=Burkholderia plantarii TaxID=41899 RepID=A0A0B6S6G7_BURPL|nr:FecR domain-containing protein [Burkholderia plantarii]AJK50044.1 Fe(2+)-dicitrate sensor, transmembrane component FecR [Burkholderia plantarii]